MNFRTLKFRRQLLIYQLLILLPVIIVGSAVVDFQVKNSLKREIENQLTTRAEHLQTTEVNSASNIDETFERIGQFRMKLWGCSAVLLILATLSAFFISRFLCRPMEKFVHSLDQPDFGEQETLPGRDEACLSPELLEIRQHMAALIGKVHYAEEKTERVVQKNLESQTALVENDLKLRSLFDRSFQYIGMLSPYGVLEQINQSMLEFSGCTMEQVLYKPFWEGSWWRHDPDVREEIKENVKLAMQGEFVRCETTAVSGDETIRHMDISFKPVFHTARQVAFIITECRDVTELRRAALEREDLAVQLERSRKMEAIGTLAGGIAHDFNNILSGILGYAQLVELSLDTPEKAKKHLSRINQGARRAADLIQQILTFSRQAEYEKHPLKLYLVVKEALKLMRSSIPATIDIDERIHSTDKVLADPTQIHQVVMNLCTNAYHAIRDSETSGGMLQVTLKTCSISNQKDAFSCKMNPGTYLELEVKDTGHGMDKEVLSKAFDPYFTTKGIGKGTGFGLALVRAIVEEHGGYIDVTSRKGSGSSFYVYLPAILDKTRKARADNGQQQLTGGSETIMVVDDENDIREVFRLFLGSLGYTVNTFENGTRALEAFEREPQKYDMVITDMTMPKMTGHELAVQIFKCRKDIPILLCSGYNESISEAQCLAIGIKQYIQKPVDNKGLAVQIRGIFDNPQDTAKA